MVEHLLYTQRVAGSSPAPSTRVRMPKLFQKHPEDFVCEHCRRRVDGTGYTNHCPSCLWSKHVDVNPGDRAEACGGMMEPIGLRLQGNERSLVHRCSICGYIRMNRTAPEDDPGALVALSARPYTLPA